MSGKQNLMLCKPFSVNRLPSSVNRHPLNFYDIMPRNDILDDFNFDENPFLEDAGDGEVVAKFYSAMEAEVAAARLRSEGVPCFIANSMSQSVLTSIQIMVRLHVRPQDFELAQNILAEAAVDAEMPIADRSTDRMIIVFLTALIFLILVLLLVQSVGGNR